MSVSKQRSERAIGSKKSSFSTVSRLAVAVAASGVATSAWATDRVANTAVTAFEAAHNINTNADTVSSGLSQNSTTELRQGYDSNGTTGRNAIYYLPIPVVSDLTQLYGAHFVTSMLTDSSANLTTPRFSSDLYALGYTFNSTAPSTTPYYYAGSGDFGSAKGFDTGAAVNAPGSVQLLQNRFFGIFNDPSNPGAIGAGLQDYGYTANRDSGSAAHDFHGYVLPDASTPGLGALAGATDPTQNVSGYTIDPNVNNPSDGKYYHIDTTTVQPFLPKGTSTSADTALLNYLKNVIYPSLGPSYTGGANLILRLNADLAPGETTPGGQGTTGAGIQRYILASYNTNVSTGVFAGAVLPTLSIATASNLVFNQPGGTFDTSATNQAFINTRSSAAASFATGDVTSFTDATVGNVTVAASGVSPYSTSISNSSGAYTFTGGGILNGSLTKSGAGTANLANGANSFTGVTATGGTLSFGAVPVYNNSSPNGPVVTSGGLTNQLIVTGALNINNGSTVALHPTVAGGGLTHSVGSLSVAANSALDIGNHGVLVQSAPDETVIQHYLERGYAGGFWNGRSVAGGSITSVTAFNDNSGATSVGFGNSADFTGTSSPYAPSGSNALTGNQVIVKTALAGDLLLRGGVGANELSLLLNSYGTKLYDGVHTNTWAYGNIDYSPDGTVGANDLSLLLGNYGKNQGGAGSLAQTASAAAATTLTSSASDGAASPGVAPANGIELDVYVLTGDVKLNGNNAGAVTAVNLASASGALIGGTNFTPEFNALFPTTASNNANQINPFNTATNGATVNGLIDMGVVFNVNGAQDLTFQFSQKGINRGGLQDATVVYIVPEPTSLCGISLAAAGLLGRRKRKAVVA